MRSRTNLELEEEVNKSKNAKIDNATVTSDPHMMIVGKLTKEVLM